MTPWKLHVQGFGFVALWVGGLAVAMHAGAAPTKKHTDGDPATRGRVLGPDGRPVTGAEVGFWAEPTEGPARRLGQAVKTDGDGRFHLEVPGDAPATTVRIVATAPGLAPDWSAPLRSGGDELTLRLASDDVPVVGKVLDLEGQPVPGIRVAVSRIGKATGSGGLDGWIATMTAGRGEEESSGVPPEAASLPASATTDAAGAFRIAGLGRDRLVRLEVRGEGVETARLTVVTRRGVEGLPAVRRVFAPPFAYLAGPTRALVGTVRDKRTGAPLAGVMVCAGDGTALSSSDVERAVTDERGRFRITGVGKHDRYWLSADLMPYFHASRTAVPDAPGVSEMEVGFELERGVAIRGRLIDQATGRPVSGRVMYIPDVENPALKDYLELRRTHFFAFPWPDSLGKTAADGSFTIVAVPGPGWLAADADDADRFTRAELEGWDGHLFPTLVSALADRPDLHHAWVRIRPTEGDPASRALDIALEPAATRDGTVAGPDGRPLSGTFAAGLSALNTYGSPSGLTKLDDGRFTISGMGRRGGRTLAFFHPGEKLAKLQPVRAGESGPLAVKLEPMGALAGRMLDATGKPWARLEVRAMPYSGPEGTRGDEGFLPLEVFGKWQDMLEEVVTTKDDGRFRLDGLVPGLLYQLVVTADGTFADANPEGGARIAHAQTSRPGGPGETKELGDLTSTLSPKKGAR